MISVPSRTRHRRCQAQAAKHFRTEETGLKDDECKPYHEPTCGSNTGGQTPAWGKVFCSSDWQRDLVLSSTREKPDPKLHVLDLNSIVPFSQQLRPHWPPACFSVHFSASPEGLCTENNDQRPQTGGNEFCIHSSGSGYAAYPELGQIVHTRLGARGFPASKAPSTAIKCKE